MRRRHRPSDTWPHRAAGRCRPAPRWLRRRGPNGGDGKSWAKYASCAASASTSRGAVSVASSNNSDIFSVSPRRRAPTAAMRSASMRRSAMPRSIGRPARSTSPTDAWRNSMIRPATGRCGADQTFGLEPLDIGCAQRDRLVEAPAVRPARSARATHAARRLSRASRASMSSLNRAEAPAPRATATDRVPGPASRHRASPRTNSFNTMGLPSLERRQRIDRGCRDQSSQAPRPRSAMSSLPVRRPRSARRAHRATALRSGRGTAGRGQSTRSRTARRAATS